MMSWLRYILIPLLLLSCSKLEDSGDMVTIIKILDTDITRIEISSNFELEVDRSNTSNEITIEVYESVEPYISYKQDENTLKLGLTTDKIDDNLHLKAYVPIDIFNEYIASEYSLIRFNSVLESTELTITLSGGSTFVGDINCEKLTYSSSGGSMGYLLGSIDEFNISKCSGGSIIESYGLLSQKIEFDISGGSRVEVSVNESLKGSCSGSSSIHYQGYPTTIDVNTTGGSSLVNAN